MLQQALPFLGLRPPIRDLISKNFSAPKSAAKPASVTTIGASFVASFVAIKELQPWAILAKGPPCTKTGFPSFGLDLA